MLPANWPRWIVAPIGFALALVSIGLGLILVLAVQASAPYSEPPPTPPRLAYAAPLSKECTACHINKGKLGETVASEEERQRLFIELSQTESLHGRLGCVTCHQGTPDTEDVKAAHTGLVPDPSLDFHENCLLCHRDLPNEFPDDGLRAPHDQVVHGLVENLTCSDCHGAVGHGFCSVSGEVVCSMTACLDCHEARNLDVQLEHCNVCHVDPHGPTADLNCSDCHKDWKGADLLGQAHAEADVTCLDCHEPTLQQQVQEGIQVATKDYQAAFAEQEFPKESCLRCHEHGSYEELIQRTEELERNPHDSHYGEMECGICHKVHRASEDYCAPCHGPVATGTGWITATQVLEWWDPDMDCAYCHVMASYIESLQDATLLANAHAQQELVCLDCHELAVLEQVHEGADPSTTQLKRRKFPNEFCFDCHVPNEHTSYEEVIKRTEDYTVDDQKINPHDPHAGSAEMGQRQFECYGCHKMHKESWGIKYCYGCHHEGTFENCSVCH